MSTPSKETPITELALRREICKIMDGVIQFNIIASPVKTYGLVKVLILAVDDFEALVFFLQSFILRSLLPVSN
jgi:hypothetical protein